MIRLTKLALQRPVTVILCLVTIAYFGFQSLIGARMELIPEMELRRTHMPAQSFIKTDALLGYGN